MRVRVGLSLIMIMALIVPLSESVTHQVFSTTEIYMTPSTNHFDLATTSVGFKFNVTILVEDVSALFAYQVCVFYNPVMINATRAWLPRWDSQWVFYGKATVNLSPIYASGYVQLGDSVYANDMFSGSGKLALIEFQIIEVPSKAEILSCSLGLDNVDTYLLDLDLIEIPAVKTNGSFSYAWSPPPTRPHLAVNPTSLKQPDIGSAFHIQLFIMDLHPNWELTNATISLSFNATIIDILGDAANVTVSSNWVGPNEVDVAHGLPDKVNITVRSPVVAEGNLLIATIEYTVMGHGITDLIFISYSLYDHVIEVPTDPSVNGLVNTEKLVSDIAVLGVESSKTIVCQGFSAYFDVALANEGDASEIFNVTVYVNLSVAQRKIVSLSNGSTMVVKFMWDTTGFDKGNYTISAYVDPLLGEIDLSDNTFIDGAIVVAMIGDISGPTLGVPDGKVDIRDIAVVAKAFGSYPGHQRWNPDADITGSAVGVPDDKVDIRDIATVAMQFGKIDP